MEWGRDVANASVEMVARDAARNMAVEVSHGQLRNKILNAIKERGRAYSIIEVLEEGGIIEAEKELPSAGGRPKIFYSME